jgi:hypothetical protein
MGMTHRRGVSRVGTDGNVNGNALSVDNQINGIGVAGARRRNSTQNGVQGGIQFLQRAVEEDLGDSDGGSPLLDDMDLDEEDQGGSDRRMRAEAKSIRKVNTPRGLWPFLVLTAFTPYRSQILRSPTGL